MDKIFEITAKEVTIQVKDERTGVEYSRTLPMDYYENANVLKLSGENLDGSSSSIVFYSARGMERLKDLTGKGADHDAITEPGEHPGGVLHRLAAADLKVTVGQEQRLTAELIHTGFEGNAGTGGGLLEDHAEALALQMAMGNIMLLFIFELICQIEQADDLLGGAVKQLQ